MDEQWIIAIPRLRALANGKASCLRAVQWATGMRTQEMTELRYMVYMETDPGDWFESEKHRTAMEAIDELEILLKEEESRYEKS